MPIKNVKPDALLLIAPGCRHCPVVLAALTQLLEKGDLGRLEVVNVAAHPEVAAELGTRSVPWCRIGQFELVGVTALSEFKSWANHAAAGSGANAYLTHLLETQRLDKVVALTEESPGLLVHLLQLVGDLQTPMAIRIGATAVFEALAGNPCLEGLVDGFGSLARAPESQIRADAAHLLGLTGNPRARAFLEPLLEDDDLEVREVAAESLPLLGNSDT